MHLAHAYKSQRLVGWSRVEMLLALYEGAINRLDKMLQDPASVSDTQMRTLRILMELRGGLDFRYGEIPAKMDQLLEFSQHCVLDGTPDRLTAARNILRTLQSAFEGIREDAIRLETEQVIPPVDVQPHIERDA